jgi:hypothetical protein
MWTQSQQNSRAVAVPAQLATRRHGVSRCFAIALTCCAIPTQAHAESTHTATRKQAAFDFAIVIPPISHVQALNTPRTIRIDEADIAQGWIDLREASTLSITSNHRHGFQISAHVDSALVESVEVRLMDRLMHVLGDLTSMVVSAPRAVDHRVGVSYRLYLKRGIRAGEYRWPVALTFTPQSV